MPLQNVANIKERYISLCIPLKMCGKNKNSWKNGNISSAACSRIFPFFLEFLCFSHFFKGMNWILKIQFFFGIFYHCFGHNNEISLEDHDFLNFVYFPDRPARLPFAKAALLLVFFCQKLMNVKFHFCNRIDSAWFLSLFFVFVENSVSKI